MIIVVMGVSGTGKSTLGRALAAALGWEFLEGDDYHPPANIAKMRRHEPLDDADRAPWLVRLNDHIAGYDRDGVSAILACSALKADYRMVLARGITDIRFVFLHGDPGLIRERLEVRKGHFMPPGLLDSQIATLEIPDDAIRVDISLTTAEQVDRLLKLLQPQTSGFVHYRAVPLVEGLAFPEGPRWYDGRLWFTDQHARSIYSLETDGTLQQVAATDDLPGGLGWLPDGSLLVVYMTRRHIMRLVDDRLDVYADLSRLASFHCNDMVVDAGGGVYVGNFGFDLHGGAPVSPAEIIRVDTDRSTRVAARDVTFPNGSVITPDDEQLLVAETFAHRISTFPLQGDGTLGDRAIWADLGEQTPDGICLDEEGVLWIASPGTSTLTRMTRDGTVLARCDTRGTPYACMLGGPDRRTLYVCTAETDDPATAAQRRTGRIEQVRVAVAGSGLP